MMRGTPTQRRVCALVADGARDVDIAKALGWTTRAAETYLKRLRTQMGARNRAHLVLIAFRKRWIE